MGGTTLNQTHVKVFADDNTNADNCTAIGTEDTRYTANPGTIYIVRFKVANGGMNYGTATFTPYVQKNTAGYTTYGNVYTEELWVADAQPTDGASLSSELLTNDGSTYQGGWYEDSSPSMPGHSIVIGEYELAFAVRINPRNVTGLDTIDMQLRNGTAVLDNYQNNSDLVFTVRSDFALISVCEIHDWRWYSTSSDSDPNNIAGNEKAAESTSYEVQSSELDTEFNLRMAIDLPWGVAGAPLAQLQFKVDSGSWTNVTASSSYVRCYTSSGITDSALCGTQLLTGTGHAFGGGGQFDKGDGRAIYAITVNASNTATETQRAIQFRSADLSGGETIQFRLVDGAISTEVIQLGAGHSWPQVTIASAGDVLLADDVEADSEVSSPAIGQKHVLDATDVQSTSNVSSPAIGQEHSLLADDVQSSSEVSSPVLSQIVDLLANDAESASEVSSPAIGQEHGLLADDVQSLSEVSSPAIEQEHALDATDVESTSEVSSPVIEQIHALLADDVQSTSEVSAPVLAEVGAGVDDLLADDVESASEVSSPAVGQEHALSATSVESAAEASSPVIGQTHELLADDAQSLSEVSSPAIAQEHALLADDVQSLSEVSSPAVAQEHALSATSVESTSEISSPAIEQIHELLADDVESTSELTTPAIAQTHELAATSVESASEVSAPPLSTEGTDALLADDVESAAEVSSPAIAQIHALLADDTESTSEVSSPSIGQIHDLLVTSVESASELTAPVLAEASHTLLAEDVESTSEVSTPSLTQLHSLVATNLESTSEVSLPGVGQVHILSATSIESTSEVVIPGLTVLEFGEASRRHMRSFMGPFIQ